MCFLGDFVLSIVTMGLKFYHKLQDMICFIILSQNVTYSFNQNIVIALMILQSNIFPAIVLSYHIV